MSADLETPDSPETAPEAALRPTPLREELSREWLALQAQCEDYEKQALRLKIVAVVLFLLGYLVAPDLSVSAILTAMLWLQEGIWKTWQSRLEDRVIQIEAMMNGTPGQAFQLYTRWKEERPSSFRLIWNYLKNALRPTVAFPYLALLVMDFWLVYAQTLETGSV